jgi:hypothetical protein
MKQIYTAPITEAAKASLNDFKRGGTLNNLMLLKIGKTIGMSLLYPLIFLLKLEK